MGFYRIHLLDVIAIDFLIVPIIMTGNFHNQNSFKYNEKQRIINDTGKNET